MKKLSILLSLLFILAIGCKQTVDSEKNRWESNKKLLKELAVEFPSFKTVINETLSKAEKAMNEAESLTDEKKKIEAMSKANGLATPKYVNDLSSFSKKVKELQNLSAEAVQNAKDENDRLAAKQASENATNAINEAKKMLQNQSVSSESDANTLASKALQNLDDIKSTLTKIIKTTTDKVNKENKEKEQIKKEQEQKEKEKKEAVADIKCEYCNTMNKHDAKKCSSCGAPLEKK